MTPLVLDASVMLRWYFRDEDELSVDLLRSLANDRVIVPMHWRAELANGVLVGERCGRAPVAQAVQLLDLIASLDLEVDSDGADNVLERILPLARAHRLTVYDALYLELAERRGVRLATFDRELAAAAGAIGVQITGSAS